MSEEVLRGRERFREFWEGFLKRLHLDNWEQPVSPPATNTNQYFIMPKGSNAWVSAYLMQSGTRGGGVSDVAKGPIGDRLYSGLRR